jgi:SAM-dependent methyltransferase
VLELSASDSGLEHAILRCDCYEYPIVAGIPVLRQISPVSSTQNEAVDALRRGDPAAATAWLSEAGAAPGVAGQRRRTGWRSAARQWADRLQGTGAPNARDFTAFERALRDSRPGPYADYLFHRFANPSFLAAIPALVVFGDHCGRSGRGRVLELLSGIGHSGSIMSTLCSRIDLLITDVDFVNLTIAHQFLAPGVPSICLDAELPLPFRDNVFDGVYCLDGLHYVKSKVGLLSEVNRVVGAGGAWLFAHMHNASGINVSPGTPLDAHGYAVRFEFGEQRLLPEREVLAQFERDGALNLDEQQDEAAVTSSNALTLFGTRDETLWRRHHRLDDALARHPELLTLNPLYVVETVADGLVATVKWPSKALQAECNANGLALPEAVHLSAELVAEIAIAKRTGSLSNRVRELIRSFVLVCLPECYPRNIDLS